MEDRNFKLAPEYFERLRRYGHLRHVERGEYLARSGDSSAKLFLVESGTLDVVRDATPGLPETVVHVHGPGAFAGELNVLTGQNMWLSIRVGTSGRVHVVESERFETLMEEEPELSDVVLRELLERRRSLKTGAAATAVEILGEHFSPDAQILRTYVSRQQIAHSWVNAGSDRGKSIIENLSLADEDLPVVLISTGQVLRRATPKLLSELLGLGFKNTSHEVVDLVVVGAGPAGLAAAVYGASEGLQTVLLDAQAVGGQAAGSSRIENYMGFTSGLSGGDLTGRAAVQALKFGAQIAAPCLVEKIENKIGDHEIHLHDGEVVTARAVVIATGASYKSLPVPRWDEYVGAGIYYAATEMEARDVSHQPVVVVGGANSAGQAALFLLSHGCSVVLTVRGHDLNAGMSAYLVRRLRADPMISIRVGSEVTGLHGSPTLDSVTVHNNITDEDDVVDCRGLFCFIGAKPATKWLHGVRTDADGFILTDRDLDDLMTRDDSSVWDGLGRRPLPFETSSPRVFAVGDVRYGSMKRVAAAVGEGASAVSSVHRALAYAQKRANASTSE
ncbi:FAD-dependent oxidoreductase [Streptomyces sp. NPDC096934]|uniref:FAD-dependent oxidoreductase n=1 Tax=Streptomyces sp. NPDC096934 TaxID=3155551 RepID=UPI00331F5F43